MWLPIAMELTSVYAGFVVFSVLGFMAFKIGRPIQEVVTEGTVSPYDGLNLKLVFRTNTTPHESK